MTRTVGRLGRLPEGWGRPGMADVLLSVLLGFFSMANPLGTSRLSGFEGADGSAAIVVFYGITAVCCTAIALRRLHPVAPVCSVCGPASRSSCCVNVGGLKSSSLIK